MKSLFSYDSKIMQALMVVGDLIIMNVLYILCCIPIITIGAAQAGLYTGVKVLLDKEDDSSCAKAFFRGFRAGFMKITVTWCLFLVILAALGYTSMTVYVLQQGYSNAPFILSVAALCIVALFQSLTSLFHARFDCTPWQLIRNAWFITLAHPLQSLIVGFTTWLPLIFGLFGNFYLFMQLTPVTLTVYYSVAFLLNFSLMKKPFQPLIDAKNEPEEASEQAEESEDEDTPALVEG